MIEVVACRLEIYKVSTAVAIIMRMVLDSLWKLDHEDEAMMVSLSKPQDVKSVNNI